MVLLTELLRSSNCLHVIFLVLTHSLRDLEPGPSIDTLRDGLVIPGRSLLP